MAEKMVTPIVEPARTGINTALLAVQREIEGLHKSATNSMFRSKYTPLPEVLKVVVPVLNGNDVLLSSYVEPLTEGWITVYTVLTHIPSGTSVNHGIPMPLVPVKVEKGGNGESAKFAVTCQAVGGAVTYGRRYGLEALLGIGEDDDANLASGKRDERAKPKMDLEDRVDAALRYYREKAGLKPDDLVAYLGRELENWGDEEVDRLKDERHAILELAPSGE